MYKEDNVVISPKQRENLINFFGEKGADIVIQHINELDKVFGSASAVIRSIMRGTDDSKQFKDSS